MVGAIPLLVRRRAACVLRTSVRLQLVCPQRGYALDTTNNAIAARYKDKLERAMKEKGVSTLEDLKVHYEDNYKQLREREPLAPTTTSPAAEDAQAKATPRPPVIPKISKEQSMKTLASFIDVDKLRQHTVPREIELIWRARFANDPNALCAVLPADVFKRMRQTAKAYPIFVLPLPRSPIESGADAAPLSAGGKSTAAEIQFMQWTFPEDYTSHCIMTSLLEFKAHKEFARPHTTLIFHTELAESHGIVLFNGSVERDMNVSNADAHFLVLTLQKFYNADTHAESAYERAKALRRHNLLEMFKGGKNFDLELLLAEAEMID
ncbi:ATP11 protein-domain-containing protein [Limtongia smithiae]|uniref:ATP11 protein-domain-containing protein n=1 Tax=Limtongia smithiae TaxID=1125753 RepID=UPI0034CDB501